MLEIKTSYQGGILNIELYGALDSLTSPDFKQWLSDKASAGYHYFALNCTGLEYMSSRGISIIVELNNILNESEPRMMLYHISNEVFNLLDFLKLSHSIPIAETFQQVQEKFGTNPLKKKPSIVQTAKPEEIPVNVEGIEKAGEQPEVKETPEPNLHVASHDVHDDSYIDLSKEKWTKHGDDISVINIIFCPNCGEKLKVSKKGLYLCPECRNKFNYPF
jgi:anti-anti-sigma factor